MPRPLRIEYEDAWYHVMNRGANHQLIFYNNNHRDIFLSLLCQIKDKFHVETHAYCLMDNHYHLLLHTPIANLGRSIRHLDGVYTQHINRIEKRDGPLFRGRYKAILVEQDSYLLAVSRYIHLNPVSANICQLPTDYPWSSCQDYMGMRTKPSWLYTDIVLKMVNERKKTYANFIDEGNSDEILTQYSKSYLPAILGKKEFIEDKLSMISQGKIQAYSIDINRTKIVIVPEKILEHLSIYFKINFVDMKKSIRGRINLPKIIGILLLRQLGQLSHSAIAKYFNCSIENISTTLKRARCLIQNDAHANMHFQKLMCIIIGMT